MATFFIAVLAVSFTVWFIYKVLDNNAEEYERYMPARFRRERNQPHYCVYKTRLTWREEDPDTIEQVRACKCGKVRR